MPWLFNKPFDEIGFEDIQKLVDIQAAESLVLDYKERWTNPDDIAKLICAFANTQGGFIVFGVSEKENNLPDKIVGMDAGDIPNQLDQVGYDKIAPPVFCQSKVIDMPDSPRKVFLVRVPESDLTPHATNGNTRVYIKVGAQKRPIEKEAYFQANLDEIEWLRLRRERSVALRKQCFQDAQQRLNLVFSPQAPVRFWLEMTVAPVYPKSGLITFETFDAFVTEFIHEFRTAHTHNITLSGEPHNHGSGVTYWTEVAKLGVAVDLTRLGVTTIRYVFEGIGQDRRRLLDIRYVGSFLKTGLAIGNDFLHRAGFGGHVLFASRLSRIRGTCMAMLRTSDRLDVYGTCEIDDDNYHESVFGGELGSDPVHDYIVAHISRIAYSYNYRDDQVSLAEHVCEYAEKEYSKH